LLQVRLSELAREGVFLVIVLISSPLNTLLRLRGSRGKGVATDPLTAKLQLSIGSTTQYSMMIDVVQISGQAGERRREKTSEI
jgi:hypothetical protein